MREQVGTVAGRRGKKKLAAQTSCERYRESEAFLAQIPERLKKEGVGSLCGWLETGLRDALFRDARLIVEELLNDRALVWDQEPPAPLETLYRDRARQVQTLFGPIELRRRYYYHTLAHTGRYPLDEALDLVRGCTPALARLICRASTTSGSYQEAANDLCAYTGLTLESRHFGRLVAEVAPVLREAHATLPAQPGPAIPVLYVLSDGTGVPMRGAELVESKGRQSDGSSRTREAKLGCVFTQTTTDTEGEPLRDPDSTSYVATFAGCRSIGTLLRQEALRRGYTKAEQTVYLGDGAAWIWENAQINFPDAVQILDFYHASEHVGLLADALCGADTLLAKKLKNSWCHQMKHSSSLPIIKKASRLVLAQQDKLSPDQLGIIQREIEYLRTNAQRSRYGSFRKKGFFIGSGVVEAGCKTIVGRRLKQSGMFWSQAGAENLLSLRCLIIGPHFEAAWQARRGILRYQRLKARRWEPSLN